ncbi:MAG: prolipoprotein diacylglyceryl transferase [Clostridia bacterium]|nr:prolipoprotein diacylglyceryl transferase [Clostridia bacterium]
MWYGIIVTSAIMCGIMYVFRRAKEEGLSEDHVYDYAFIVVASAIACARLYYVVFDPDPHYNSFLDVIAIWEGGLAIYGGIIGGAIAVFAVSRWRKVYFWRFADMICPAVMLGQVIGRWGNYVNCEAYGSVTTFEFFFWSFDISASALKNPVLMTVNGLLAQPTFLYESLWNAVGFVLIVFVINKRRKFAGMNAFFYFSWYGFGRMFIEGLRTDSLYLIGNNTLKISQLLAALTFLGFTTALILCSIKAKKHPCDLTASVYYAAPQKSTEGVASDDSGSEQNASTDQGLDGSEQSTVFVSKNDADQSNDNSEE